MFRCVAAPARLAFALGILALSLFVTRGLLALALLSAGFGVFPRLGRFGFVPLIRLALALLALFFAFALFARSALLAGLVLARLLLVLRILPAARILSLLTWLIFGLRLLLAEILFRLRHFVLGELFTLRLGHRGLDHDLLLRRFEPVRLKLAIVLQGQPILNPVAFLETQRLQVESDRRLNLLDGLFGLRIDQFDRLLKDLATLVNMKLGRGDAEIVIGFHHKRNPRIGRPRSRRFRADETCRRRHILHHTNVVKHRLRVRLPVDRVELDGILSVRLHDERAAQLAGLARQRHKRNGRLRTEVEQT